MRKQARLYFLSVLLLCTYLMGYGQQKTVRGTLLDNQNEPVAGASVMEKGTPNGTSSDAAGNFTLNVRQASTLVITAVGFETTEIPVGDQTTLNIKLALESIDRVNFICLCHIGTLKFRYGISQLPLGF